MKRFTETNKWRDAWFRRLSAGAKLVWIYLTENCDQVGMIEIDFGLLSSDCGMKITGAHLNELGSRLQKISDGRFLIPKFIYFQYGELSPTCPPHKTVLRLIEIHQLRKSGLFYLHPNGTEFKFTAAPEEEKTVEPTAKQEQALAIYDAYPRKISRPDALRAITKALTKIDFEKLLNLTQKYAQARIGEPDQYTPHPATWFNAERFNDDPATWKSNLQTGKPNPRNFGIVGETTYGDGAKPRLQRELEEKKRLAGEVASDGGNSSANHGSPE